MRRQMLSLAVLLLALAPSALGETLTASARDRYAKLAIIEASNGSVLAAVSGLVNEEWEKNFIARIVFFGEFTSGEVEVKGTFKAAKYNVSEGALSINLADFKEITKMREPARLLFTGARNITGVLVDYYDAAILVQLRERGLANAVIKLSPRGGEHSVIQVETDNIGRAHVNFLPNIEYNLTISAKKRNYVVNGLVFSEEDNGKTLLADLSSQIIYLSESAYPIEEEDKKPTVITTPSEPSKPAPPLYPHMLPYAAAAVVAASAAAYIIVRRRKSR